ncbi:hypothetical protein PSTG_14540 [Puccinia striiformis f. sp. tritici PST-78]|uniref:Uncharacterized protein n=1 Tax=Puccinia striiformis f. sp. tritici PST-78 TaxID=1165861 RepID=A0A0L0UZ97_9BASI|nr:hypothetical protein PSTG_14540 [Puccinia striiformis f. sp. tritici PST-78]
MSFLGLSLVTWQTLLIIGFPLIYGSLSRIRSVLLFIRNPFKKKGPSSTEEKLSHTRNPHHQVLPPPPPRRYLRPQSFVLGLSLIILVTRYVNHNPAQTNPFKLTKHLLNVPSTTLTSSMERYYRLKGIDQLPYEQERLIKKLNTLESRMLYSTLGPIPFLECSWCRPPSQAKSKGIDHLYFILSRLIFQYGCLLFGIGVLTTGASQANMKRKIWRTRLTLTSILCLVIEGSLLSVLVYIPAIITSLDKRRMTWDTLFFLRSLFFALVLGAAWWSVISEPPKNFLSPTHKLGLSLNSLGVHLDGLVNRLRLTALQRTTIMKDLHYRTQINQFWENVENQSSLASSNPSIKTIKDKMGLGNTTTTTLSDQIQKEEQDDGEDGQARKVSNHQTRDQLRNWIDSVFPDPSFDDPTTTPISL